MAYNKRKKYFAMTDDEINVENFRVVLARLHAVGLRLQHTHFAFNMYAEEFLNAKTFLDKEPTKEEKLEISKQFFKLEITLTSLFERLVINLYSMLEIHKELMPFLEKKHLENLEKSLEDCWSKIQESEELICKWRNLILAHGKTWKKEDIFAITDIVDDTIDARNKINVTSQCGVMYAQGILKNIHEYQDALNEFLEKHKGIAHYNHLNYLKTKPIAEKILEKTKEKLRESGFKNDISLYIKQ